MGVINSPFGTEQGGWPSEPPPPADLRPGCAERHVASALQVERTCEAPLNQDYAVEMVCGVTVRSVGVRSIETFNTVT